MWPGIRENMEEGVLREPRNGALTGMHQVLGSISNKRERNLCSIHDMLSIIPTLGKWRTKGQSSILSSDRYIDSYIDPMKANLVYNCLKKKS